MSMQPRWILSFHFYSLGLDESPPHPIVATGNILNYSRSSTCLVCLSQAHKTKIKFKKNPQIVGQRPPRCPTNIPTHKHNANPLTIVAHLLLYCVYNAVRSKILVDGRIIIERLLVTSQRPSIHSFALSVAVWSEFQCEIMSPNSTSRLVVRVGLCGRK